MVFRGDPHIRDSKFRGMTLRPWPCQEIPSLSRKLERLSHKASDKPKYFRRFFLEKDLASIQHSALTSSQVYVRTRISSLIIAACTACH